MAINEIKRKILQVAHKSGEGHLGSSFSILDILYVLYSKVMNVSPINLDSEDRDFLILSKGHASLAHSAILNDQGFINDEQFYSYCSHESILGGHLSRCKVPGVEASTGSLGHGISMSIGIALASKIKRIENKIFVIAGDGEINEGTFWEAMLLGSHHNLDNLYCIVDYNRSNDRALKLDPLDDKLRGMGWDVTAINGHSHSEIYEALTKSNNDRPNAIIANTVKGKGIKEMENNPAWHHRMPNAEELESMLEELK
tara:strand:+ start:263 stop:1030 length:768 start_codon:yes stop_codon:yes gene_type:complete